jgi:hypothetical protein
MRTFKTCRPRALPVRSLVIVAGALLLMAAFVPRTNADLIVYYNFEDGVVNTRPPDFTSEGEIAFFGRLSPRGDRPITTNYGNLGLITVASTATDNRAPNDPDPPLLAMGLSRSGANSPADFNINLDTPQGFFSNMTVSFAINAQGNGFTGAAVLFSTNGGGTFTQAGSVIVPNSGTIVVSIPLPAAANNTPLLTVRIELTGGQSNGTNLQNVIDNITIGGTIVPEPATVAGGLLGVLGLCWFQRRRLLRSVWLRRA